MNALIGFISTNSSLFFLIIAAVIVILVVAIIALVVWMTALRQRLKIFFKGSKGQDLEDLIAQQIKRQIKSEKDIHELFKSSQDLWKIATKSVQKVGVVRFNPFKDTGGDQSFAIALLDMNDDGVIISSLFTREETRIYTKPIEKGKSKYSLSKEEEEAIKKAKGNK